MPNDDTPTENPNNAEGVPPKEATPASEAPRHVEPTQGEPSEIPWALPADTSELRSEVPLAEPAYPREVEEVIPFVGPVRSYRTAETAAKPRRPHPGFWWSFLWCLAFYVLVIVAAVAVGALAVAIQIALSDDPEALVQRIRTEGLSNSPELKGLLTNAIGSGTLVSELFSLAFPLLVIRLIVGREWRRRLALSWPGFTCLVLVLLGLPGLMYLDTVVHEWASHVLPTMGTEKELEEMIANWPWWVGVLVIGVSPAVGEELWFRGFLGRGLVGRHGALIGTLFTSFFFGLLHVDPPRIVATAVMGLCLHFTYLMTRSLLVPIVLHFLNNSLSVLSVTLLASHRPAAPSEHAAWLEEIGQQVYGALWRFLDPAATVSGLACVAAVPLLAAVGWALYRGRARLALVGDSHCEAWRPEFPGVEYPPADSATRVLRGRPGWLASGLVVVALLIFGILA